MNNDPYYYRYRGHEAYKPVVLDMTGSGMFSEFELCNAIFDHWRQKEKIEKVLVTQEQYDHTQEHTHEWLVRVKDRRYEMDLQTIDFEIV